MTVVNLTPVFNLADVTTLTLDLANPRPKDVLALVEAIETDIKAKPELGPLPVTTGWNEITPTTAVDLLRRNRPGANRKVDPATVFYYASQMANGDWKATGQPILLDSNGHLNDAQHRLLAVLISGATIKSYVVADIEPMPNLFAYIDNARPRTIATALQTSGLNGVAPTIAKVIRIAEEVNAGIYNPAGATKLARMSPAEVLRIVDKYPNAQKASRSAASDWSDTVDYLGGRKDIVAYLGMRIIDLHGENVADDFFEDIMEDNQTRPSDHPIAALRKLVDKDNRDEKPMKRQFMLAALIKAFNAWRRSDVLGRRWMLQVNEDFPKLDEPQEVSEAA